MTLAGRRPMTALEKKRAIALGPLRYPVGRFPKSFARDMAALARETNPEVTERQAATLEFLAWRYREQATMGAVTSCPSSSRLPCSNSPSALRSRPGGPGRTRREPPKVREVREKYERAREGKW